MLDRHEDVVKVAINKVDMEVGGGGGWLMCLVFSNSVIKFWKVCKPLGAVHILRNTGWGGSSRFITILHRGGVSPIYYNIT